MKTRATAGATAIATAIAIAIAIAVAIAIAKERLSEAASLFRLCIAFVLSCAGLVALSCACLVVLSCACLVVLSCACLVVLSCACLVGMCILPCSSFAYTRDYAPNPGYVSSVEGEREAGLQDMVVIEPPAETGPTLRQRIFNDKLTKEFEDRYQEKFGRTQALQTYYASNQFTWIQDSYGFKGSIRDVNDERAKFGNYMAQRLVEWHLENYAKTDKSTRAIWAAKERVSNMKVTTENFKLDMAYQIGVNVLDLKARSKWADSRLILQMPQGSLLPGRVQETTFSIGRDVTGSVRIESRYALTDGIVSLVGTKQIAPLLSTSILVSTYTHPGGTSTRESLYIAGVSYIF